MAKNGDGGCCLAVLVALIAMGYGAWSRQHLFWVFVLGPPPAPSFLSTHRWKAPPFISQEDILQFQETGVFVLRQVMDPIAIDALREESERICTWHMFFTGFCYTRQNRWTNDLFRDFLFHSQIGEIVDKFIGAQGVRVVQDGVFGVRDTWNPFIFSYIPHVDHGGNPGIYGRVHSNTTGVSAWMPLQDIDHEVDGGSLILYNNFSNTRCKTHYGSVVMDPKYVVNITDVSSVCKQFILQFVEDIKSFRKGDLLLFDANMLHNTQKIVRPDFVRFAWHAWFVDSDATSCWNRDCWNRGEPCCERDLPNPGDKIHTPCYAQVAPRPLKHELDAHFGDGNMPRPLVTWRPDTKQRLPEAEHACNHRHTSIT